MNCRLHIAHCRLWLLLVLLLSGCGTPGATSTPTAATTTTPPTSAPTSAPIEAATAAPTSAPTNAPPTSTATSAPTVAATETATSAPPTQTVGEGKIIFLDNDGVTIRTIRPDGSDLQVLTVVEKQPQVELLRMAASSDGRYLVYSLGDYAAAEPLRSFLVEGGASTQIETLAGTPNFSPDGTRFVAAGFTDSGSYGGPIMLYDLATRSAARLPVAGNAEWIANGTRLLYLDDTTIGTYDLTSGVTTTIVSLPKEGDDRWYIEQAQLLPNNERVVFYGGRRNMLGASGNGMQWWAVPVSGGEPQAISETGGNRVPDFALNPQADLLAYSESFHVNVCISAYSLAIRPSNLEGDVRFAPLPGVDNDTQLAYIEGFSWLNDDQIVFGLRPYTCADTTDYQVGEASIYRWNVRGGDEHPVKIADGSYPIWIE